MIPSSMIVAGGTCNSLQMILMMSFCQTPFGMTSDDIAMFTSFVLVLVWLPLRTEIKSSFDESTKSSDDLPLLGGYCIHVHVYTICTCILIYIYICLFVLYVAIHIHIYIYIVQVCFLTELTELNCFWI